MGLQTYKKKRSFKNTPEPTGGAAGDNTLRFVIQKHAASHLHYDFRLELRGVLKSWAVPKGPSVNPRDKRLAMLVEDHPYDYKDFEGIIPEGNYGAGTVIIWDQGTYAPVEEASTKSEQEKTLMKGFYAGSLKFVLKGKKLKGEYTLVKTPARADNAWLLIKHRDKYASEKDITAKNKSVVSGKTVEQLAKSKKPKEWVSDQQDKKQPETKTPLKQKRTAAAPSEVTRSLKKISKLKNSSTSKENELVPQATGTDKSTSSRKTQDSLKTPKNAERMQRPEDLEPMLATLVDAPVNGEGWIFEIKWDGFRTLAYLGNEINLRSRNNKSFDERFYPIRDALKSWPINALVDGEIVVINAQGYPDFEALQGWRSEADGQLVYYVFDLLWVEGFSLLQVPLSERRWILQSLMIDHPSIRLSEHFKIEGKEFYQLASKMDLEGIMAKRASSIYQPGSRTRDWLKIKTEKHQEVVIAGYTKNEGTRKPFSALLMSIYQRDELQFIGLVGTGFTVKMQLELLQKFKPLETKECPFHTAPDYNKPSRFRPAPPRAEVVWMQPELVAEISYRTVTHDGALRHPSFRGLREDKRPEDVVWEKAVPIETVAGADEDNDRIKLLNPPAATGRKTLLNPKEETQVRNVGGHDLKFANLSKVFWPNGNITKRDMINYYYQIAPYMLPYMKDRPQSLNRFPNGVTGKSFYQKDVTGKVPEWMTTYEYFSEADDRAKHFLVCADEATLLYIAALGCIEMNPWSSRTQNPNHPDWCIIDLDPDQNPFDQVISAAQTTKDVLDAVGIKSYCKTSGSTGLHIYIPLAAKYTYEDSKEFARRIVKLVHRRLPEFTSIERPTANRKGKIYLDFLQNRPQATVAAPYSLRPKDVPTVSMPLDWSEVAKGLKIVNFTVHNSLERLQQHGDLFKNVLAEDTDVLAANVQLDDLLANG